MTVRDTLPERRDNPTESPTGKNWSKHKPDLKEDFNSSCGYCGSFDGFRHTYFEVDHFIPKSLFEKNDIIGYCQYNNLVYSCKFCNNIKSSKWPSKNEGIPNIDNEGFIDPCNSDYDDNLYRTEEGGIMWSSDLGKWMATKAFKFDERDYSIKLLWNLNQIRKIIDALIELFSQEEENSDDYIAIKSEAEKYSLEYFIYHKQLIEYYNE